MKRSLETKHSHSVTLTLVTGGGGERASVLSPFGPVRAGLTISLRTSEVRLHSVSLSTWAKQVESQPFRSSEGCDISNTGILPLVERGISILEKDGTK